MKKSVLTLFFAFLTVVSWAYDVKIDGIYYNLVNKMKIAEVTSGDLQYSGSVVIPEQITVDGTTYSVTSIGDEAFGWCFYLTSIEIPNSVTSIGNYAFDNSSLTSVTIPNSVVSIGNDAFAYCHCMTSVTIPNSVTSIGDRTFYWCENLTTVTIPNSVVSIGDGMFTYCYGLTSVTIPNSVTSIGYGAFQDCHNMTSVTIPNSVTSIGNYAFSGCSSLTSIEIPNSVMSIGNGAFTMCSGLKNLTLGSGLMYIEDNSFASCKNLEKVTCLGGNVPYANSNVFENSYIDYAMLVVPDASKDAYSTATPWKDFGTILGLSEAPYYITYFVDGELYKKVEYKYGETITPEAEPTREGYTFSGWSEIPATMPAHDVKVNGSFTINKYTIVFVDEDGTVLQSSEVAYGATPVYSGATPTKAATAEYSYTFAGWTPEIVAATADATYTATYTSTTNQYKLTYKVDGELYKEYTLSYGAEITPEAEPTKEGYTFSGWSEIPATMPAHDVEVTGTFDLNVTEVILPVVEDGSDIDEQNVADITEFKLALNNVDTFEVNDNASAELLIDDVLSGTAGKDDISEEDGVVTIKFNFIDNGENAPAKLKAFWNSVARAAEDEVSVEVIIAAGSFNINGEDVTEDISYSYTAPASVAEEIEETLSSIHEVVADEDSTEVYNLNGIRVSKNQKGIVIKNGKAYFVK